VIFVFFLSIDKEGSFLYASLFQFPVAVVAAAAGYKILYALRGCRSSRQKVRPFLGILIFC
jgi:hypothetical protein